MHGFSCPTSTEMAQKDKGKLHPTTRFYFLILVTLSNEVGEVSELNALFMNDSYHR